jgi:hypothetical protein
MVLEAAEKIGCKKYITARDIIEVSKRKEGERDRRGIERRKGEERINENATLLNRLAQK